MKKLYFGADHGGFPAKQKQLDVDWGEEWEVIDCGAYELDPGDDYPDFVVKMVEELRKDWAAGVESRGVIFCTTGTGVAIAANKFSEVRAGNCFSEEHARLAVEHNHINVLCVPAKFIAEENVEKIIEVFLNAKEDRDERHRRRIAKVMKIDN